MFEGQQTKDDQLIPETSHNSRLLMSNKVKKTGGEEEKEREEEEEEVGVRTKRTCFLTAGLAASKAGERCEQRQKSAVPTLLRQAGGHREEAVWGRGPPGCCRHKRI